jgi:hypothetical protein
MWLQDQTQEQLPASIFTKKVVSLKHIIIIPENLLGSIIYIACLEFLGTRVIRIPTAILRNNDEPCLSTRLESYHYRMEHDGTKVLFWRHASSVQYRRAT